MNCFTKKLALVIAPLISITFLINCNEGKGGGGVNPRTYTLLTQTKNINISSNVLDNTKDYSGTIKINEGAKFALPEGLDSVIVNDEYSTSILYDCEYKRIDYNTATLVIPKEAIVSNIDFELTLIPTYTISTQTENITIQPTKLIEGVKYVGTISVNDGIDKSVPDTLDSIKVEGTGNIPYKLTLTGSKEAMLEIDESYVTGNIDFELTLTDLRDEFDIQPESKHMTIKPSKLVDGVNYTGTIALDESASGSILPETIDYVKKADGGVDITESCRYERTKNTEAILEIPKEFIKCNISFKLTLIAPENQRWYDYEDWWNYCSNGNAKIQADKTKDIGKIVKVKINDLDHEVRLIGCDKDVISGTSPSKTAHCTFEFRNVISYINENEEISYFKKHWDESKGFASTNCNYKTSTINIFLNGNNEDTAGSVVAMLPEQLQKSVKLVSKKVGISTDSGASYSPKPFDSKLFLLAHNEMFDNASRVTPDEGDKYQFYVDHPSDFLKYTIGEESERCGYWLRSPYVRDETHNLHAWEVEMSPEAFEVGQVSCGIGPAFCI